MDPEKEDNSFKFKFPECSTSISAGSIPKGDVYEVYTIP